jgi:hypothetical protein
MKLLQGAGVRCGQSHPIPRLRRVRLYVEPLEARTLLSLYPLSPFQVRHDYGFDQVSNYGAGQTIGIVDAYDDPNIFKDLDTFDKNYGLTPSGPSLYQQFGASSTLLAKVTSGVKPGASSDWAQEISLDVEWAHAIAPAARLVLVEAANSSLSNLLNAVDTAVHRGATVVSMSWGGGEFAAESIDDSHFQVPNVTFVAASGDAGPATQYPAVSPDVLAVGGTSLTTNTAGDRSSETSWGGSGGGVSSFETQPTYQKGVVTQSTTQRTSPDVSYNADPNTGVAVYDSYRGGGGWGQYGGTSAGAPQWAGLIALADEQRVAAGKTTLTGSTQTLPALYNAPGDFNKIPSDSTRAASVGHDVVTGLGTPMAKAVIATLVNTTLPATVKVGPSPTVASKSGNQASPAVEVKKTAATGDETPTLEPIQTSTPTNPVSGSAPALVKAVLGAPQPATVAAAPLSTRIESGGGQNAMIPDDSDAPTDVPPDYQRVPMPKTQGLVQEGRLEEDLVAVQLGEETWSESYSWELAATACFAEGDVPATRAAIALRPEMARAALDPAAALAGCLLALGASWSCETEGTQPMRRLLSRWPPKGDGVPEGLVH